MEVDALTKRFRAKGYAAAARIEGGGVSLEFSKLPPLLRVLLLQDGTVTKTLEAYFWEPVTIITLAQQMDVLGDDVIPGCGADMVVLHRQVEIAGDTSGRLYCLASSLVRTDLLPDSIAARLIAGKIGIGELLRDKGLETYRELEAMFISLDSDRGIMIARNYLIYLHQVPVVKITERFPLSVYSVSINSL